MGLRLKLFALMALVLVAQGAHAGIGNLVDPNMNPDSPFRKKLQNGDLCPKMSNSSAPSAFENGSTELSSVTPTAKPGKGRKVD